MCRVASTLQCNFASLLAVRLFVPAYIQLDDLLRSVSEECVQLDLRATTAPPASLSALILWRHLRSNPAYTGQLWAMQEFARPHVQRVTNFTVDSKIAFSRW